jgi:hypothetical protein
MGAAKTALTVGPAEIGAAAFGASLRPACSERNLPTVAAIETLKLSLGGHFNDASFDFYRFAVDQSIGDFFVGRFYYPPESRAGYFHFGCRFVLIEPLQIG